ncbi:MAG: hypothetical protein KC619_34895, partial [Myxococcales bacterium]|nr:hypothetical protein [Myxococcales bacterium]
MTPQEDLGSLDPGDALARIAHAELHVDAAGRFTPPFRWPRPVAPLHADVQLALARLVSRASLALPPDAEALTGGARIAWDRAAL